MCILFESQRQRRREQEKSSSLWPAIAKTGSGQSGSLELKSQSPTWVAGPHPLEPSLAASQSDHQESGISSRDRTQTQAL